MLRVTGLFSAASAIVLTTAMLAGCSSGSTEEPAQPAQPNTAEADPTDDQEPADQPGGQMIVQYDEQADTPEAQAGRQLMIDNQLLESFAEDLNGFLALPEDVPLIGRQCDEANAYWSPSDRTMNICYEDPEFAYQYFQRIGDDDPLASALGSERATFYHELGHAALDIYDLPFTGREEDVADQLAAVLLLQPEEDGQIDPDNARAAVSYAEMFQGYMDDRGGDAGDFPFWDTHEYDAARMYNFQCWIYGADPDANAYIVDEGQLPQDRADSCELEFDQMSVAWLRMLEPHLRDDQ